MIESQIVDGGKYYGIVDWYVPDFYNEKGKGCLYIGVNTFHQTHFSKTFQMCEDDVLVGKKFITKNLGSEGDSKQIPEFETGDVVEFVASIDTARGCVAKAIRYYGSNEHTFVRHKLDDQERQLKLGIMRQVPKGTLKLVVRPRGKSE